ncbi:MAG: sulfatase-like hydrolase/transferase [Myxococcota bacterium]
MARSWWFGCVAAITGCEAEIVDSDSGVAPGVQVGPANVLIVVVDDLGTDLVDAYGTGGAPAHMPTVDGLVSEGVLFERAYATPVCSSTRASLLTGRHGRRTGVGGVIMTESDFALALDEVTVAEVLTAAPTPYATAAFGKWHLAGGAWPGWERHPLDQGFGSYAGAPGNIEAARGYGYDHWLKNTNGVLAETTTYATTDTVNDAIAAVGSLPEPWFVYVAFNGVHLPSHVPPPELAPPPVDDSEAARVRAAATAVDTELGRLLDAIDPTVRANTTVILLGDNGTTSVAVVPPQDPLRATGTQFEGGVRVPFVVTGPAVGSPGTRTDALVHVVDVMPTLAELSGTDLQGLRGMGGMPPVLDGISFAGVLADPAAPGPRSTVYTERFTPNGPRSTVYTERSAANGVLGALTLDEASIRDERYTLIRVGSDLSLYDHLANPVDDGPDLLADGRSPDEDREVARLVDALDAVRTATSSEAR